MIIIKNVPGLTTPEVMAAVADHIPLEQIETGYGGIVVDERTALVFLQRYLTAIDGGPMTISETPTSANETPAPEETVKTRTTTTTRRR